MSFFFGDESQRAQSYYYDALARMGPGVPEVHPDELSHQELIDCMVYIGSAVKDALIDGNTDAADKLFAYYDEVFVMLIELDEGFKERFIDGRVFPLTGRPGRNKGYYRALAGI